MINLGVGAPDHGPPAARARPKLRPPTRLRASALNGQAYFYRVAAASVIGTGAASPWTSTAGVISNNTAEPSHSGSWDAWLDGYGSTHTDTLAQSVTIPAASTSASLSFWLHIDTAETTTTTAYDTLTVQVLNPTGGVLAALHTWPNLNANAGYSRQSFDVTAYKGQNITIKFTGTEDSTLKTSFVIDDTALTTN